MLGKLIKYDIKSMNRFLILIHAFLIAASLFIRFFLTGPLLRPEVDLSQTHYGLLISLTIILCILLITGVFFATYLIIIVRFYKNLFSDQGYLSHTLPVTSGQHLLSKTIAGSIWGCVDMLLICLSVYIVVVTPYVSEIFESNGSDILYVLGFGDSYNHVHWGMFLTFLAITSVVGVVSNIVTYFASIAIGQLVPGHKVLGAIAAYFVLTTVLSIVSLVSMAIWGYVNVSAIHPDSYMADYLTSSLTGANILSAITTVILYIITYWIMKKKINLD